MRPLIYIFAIVLFLGLMLGADFKTESIDTIKAAPKGCGYTIIEAGSAINCHGDTISVQRLHPEIAALR